MMFHKGYLYAFVRINTGKPYMALKSETYAAGIFRGIYIEKVILKNEIQSS